MDFGAYREAVIHLAWYRDHIVNHLLFGMIELRPTEFPPAMPCARKAFRARRSTKKDFQFVHYQRFVLGVYEAVGWFRRAALGSTVIPNDPDTGLVSGSFVDEPPWPHFVTPSVAESLPFAPDWMKGSRVHYLFPRQEVESTIRKTVQESENRLRLSNWLNFDLACEFEDYQGAICLVAPNPLFRSVRKSHQETRPGASQETVGYHFIARYGQRVAGCRLEVTNERLRGRMAPLVTEVDDEPIAELRHQARVHKEGLSVSHADHGLLYWYDPHVLIRAVHANIGIVGRHKQVHVPARGKKRPRYTFDVDEINESTETLIDERPDDHDIHGRLVRADVRRERQRTALDYDQKWFHDVPAEAAEWVRETIGQARAVVMIVDPYFATPELFAFGLAIREPTVALRVLISADAIKERAARTLLDNLDATSHAFATPPLIRISSGTRGIHDRFLVIDGGVWFSGNSFNALGERASMVVKLPDSETVVSKLEAVWEGATPLADWLVGAER